ncbi:MAG TPA: DUF2891 domain-containing protein [Parvularculaceae bacterium]|nr:DUF2891 domain-containing protein [Parvularculaceae bacterium]
MNAARLVIAGAAALMLMNPAHAQSSPMRMLRPGSVTDRFAVLALDCIKREYPNKISHTMSSDADVAPSRVLHPAFYGCFDWHSSVHGHWLLTRILATDPETPLTDEIIAKLSGSFQPVRIAAEAAYILADHREDFERPYGLAWLLQLVAELDEWSDPHGREWRETLRPLEEAVVWRIEKWLPNLVYPIRIGTHNQTAFAFGLMLDYAREAKNAELAALIEKKSRDFYAGDTDCPIGYEPSGEDFLSPCLAEADLMRRVMAQKEFAKWLKKFLPGIPKDGSSDWLEPGVVLDPTDGKLAHLDGLNLSRAWMLEGVASALPKKDKRRAALLATAAIHEKTGVAAVSSEHYEGSHWLASFAMYLETKRGISRAGE